MPKPRQALNAFPPAQTAKVVGMSVHMLNYLAREGYLEPAYSHSRRGRTRYYSFRDLVIARVVARLLEAGLEIRKLKEGIKKLSSHSGWTDDPKLMVRMLATDGRNLFFVRKDGIVIDLTRHGQHAFAFVLDIEAAQADVQKKLTADQLQNFSLTNRRLKFVG